MRGDIDERPSDVYNRPTTNLGLLQTTTTTANLNSPTSASSPTMTINDEHLKNKSIQDVFRTNRPISVDPLSNTTTTTTACSAISTRLCCSTSKFYKTKRYNHEFKINII